MTEYLVVAKTDQVVTKEIQLLVEAENEGEAMAKATSALGEYPREVTEQGIKRIKSLSAHYWIPKAIEFKKVRKNS